MKRQKVKPSKTVKRQKVKPSRIVSVLEDESPKTLSVPEAGRLYFDLQRAAAYAAAKRGDFPTIRIGHKLRVSVVALDRMLDVKPREAAGPQKLLTSKQIEAA